MSSSRAARREPAVSEPDRRGWIRTLIVDDEPLAREGLRALLELDPEVDVVGECGDGRSAAEAIATLRPDLVFLDIQMPEADGFAALREARGELPLVVFVTGYDRYAIRAFDVRALDYLLKPFDDERLQEALSRAKSRLRERQAAALTERIAGLLAERGREGEEGSGAASERLEEEERLGVDAGAAAAGRGRSPGGYLKGLIVRRAGRVLVLKAEEIDWIEAADYYVRVHAGDQAHLLRTTMKRLDRSLDPSLFVRVHRSVIVRLDFVREVRPDGSGDYEVLLRDGTTVSLSRSRRRLLEDRLARRLNLSGGPARPASSPPPDERRGARRPSAPPRAGGRPRRSLQR